MSIKYLSGDSKKAAGYKDLEFGRKVQAASIHLGTVGIEMVFKAETGGDHQENECYD